MNKPSRHFLAREGHRPKRKPPEAKVETRQCPARGCPRILATDMIMCGPCWRQVPAPIQGELWFERTKSMKAKRWTPRFLELRRQALVIAEGARQPTLKEADRVD